ncbi:MAG: host specificity protein [Rhodobacteraceae bacterium]|nr:MAG: host specificity protein [Paracoccaceae bacterium]
MATLVLASAGAALGGALGAAVFGGAGATAGALVGRAAGGLIGGALDQRLLGGAAAVETGRASGFRVMGAREGAPIPRVFGRMRVAGNVIWASRFHEHVDRTTRGSKAARATVTTRSYTVSLAVALCEGPIDGIGRIWADGALLPAGAAEVRLHRGGPDAQPDPLIEALEGPGAAPAYRGVAYVVFEHLDLGLFGNRIPQFHVEVRRQPRVDPALSPEFERPLPELIEAVALSPGTGEFSLETQVVRRRLGPGRTVPENAVGDDGPDLLAALDQLEAEAPACRAALLIVSWFGDDLRCGRCRVEPAVEETDKTTEPVRWVVGGLERGSAKRVGRADGRPVYGGTPSDRSVIAAIRELRARGMAVTFYPFLLMDVGPDNALGDPYGGAAQAAYPWRGRITLERAPGVAGSADKTRAAADEVAAFFGAARGDDFAAVGETVRYSGPEEWSLRRFILHYAHLCRLAGGVDAFCIGSEMRGLTTIRSGPESYPAVAAFRALAEEVRAILGPETKIGYAADWSEYAGHRPDDGSGDVLFHLDPLWASDAIDFVGIDNYMPLADWRDGDDHLDVGAGSIGSLPYLRANVEGGEGYDWFYASAEDRRAQRRTPIVDTAHGEDWVFRVKDLRNWWGSPHHDRPGGVRRTTPTAWAPGSKPIWFTEIGCGAVDKGPNQPNVFLDPKSSEHAAPWFSTGAVDAYAQRRFLQAALGYWRAPGVNPVSPVYGGPMIDTGMTHVWTWDARPWPAFPQRLDLWSDGENHLRGHWITGRMAAAGLAEVVAEICVAAGVEAFDVDGLHGVVEGYLLDATATGRQALQPLMLAYDFDAAEAGGRLRFAHRGGRSVTIVDPPALVDDAPKVWIAREGAGERPTAARLGFLDADAAYAPTAVEARREAAGPERVEATEAALALSRDAAQRTVEGWLSEVGAPVEEARFALGPSAARFEPGDVVTLALDEGAGDWRIERIEDQGARRITARRMRRRQAAHGAPWTPRVAVAQPPPAGPVEAVFVDAPRTAGSAGGAVVGAFAEPWPGAVSIWLAPEGEAPRLAAQVHRPAVVGALAAPLAAAAPHRWVQGEAVVRLHGGGLASTTRRAVLDGANLAAVRGASGAWEVLQFARAELVEPGVWRLSALLRGQAGTEAAIGDPTPAGAAFVLLDAALAPLDDAAAPHGLERRFRVGPAALRHDHETYRSAEATFDHAGRRPLRPARLRAARTAEGVRLTWAARRREDADGWAEPSWDGAPEATFRVRVATTAGLRSTLVVQGETALLTPGALAAAGATGRLEIGVAEIGGALGCGPEARIIIDG